MQAPLRSLGRALPLRALATGLRSRPPAGLACVRGFAALDPYEQHSDPYAREPGHDPYAPGARRQSYDQGGGGSYGRRQGEAGGREDFGARPQRRRDDFGGRRDDFGGRDDYGGRPSFQGGRHSDGGSESFERQRPGLLGGMPDRMGGVGENLKQLNWQEESLVTIRKNFYVEHAEIAAMSQQQVAQSMQELNARVEGASPHPRPVRSFAHITVPPELMSGMTAAGFSDPTPIQSVGWPTALSGRDMVGIAQTGSGKTLAYLLPALVHISAQPPLRPGDGPVGLILAPTRELAMQIQTEVVRLTQGSAIRCTACFGGVSRYGQASELRRGVQIVVATPGRLLDFLEAGVTNLKRVTYLCLDEADRMLDMGFEPQIRKIMDTITTDRQTAMFTATWPKECKRLAERYIKDPVQIQIGSDDITTNQNIRQHVEVCSDQKAKDEALKRILGYLGRSGNCLVFCNTKRKCRDLAWELGNDRSLGLSALELHGDLDQRARDTALSSFRSGEVRVLVATDVAARGLDIRNISTVVNYDAPNDAESYVHRIGRTGRAGDKGDAYTFLSSWGDEKKAGNILGIMEKAQQEVPQALRDLVGGRGGGGGGGGGGGSSGGWGESKDSWDKSDDKWGDKKDEWWKKDDQKEEKKDEWWKKDEKADEWWKKEDKKDDWKRDDDKRDDWKKDDWKKEDKKEDDWKKDDRWADKGSDWKKDESVSWRDASREDRPEEAPEPDAPMEDEDPEPAPDGLSDQKPGSLFSLLGSGSKRPASEDGEPDAEEPPEKRARSGEAEEEGAPPEEEQEDSTSVEALVQAGQGTRLKVGDLKCWLEERGLPTNGVKTTLIERVQEYIADAA